MQLHENRLETELWTQAAATSHSSQANERFRFEFSFCGRIAVSSVDTSQDWSFEINQNLHYPQHGVPRLSATGALFSHTVAAIFAVHLPPVNSLETATIVKELPIMKQQQPNCQTFIQIDKISNDSCSKLSVWCRHVASISTFKISQIRDRERFHFHTNVKTLANFPLANYNPVSQAPSQTRRGRVQAGVIRLIV